VNATTGRSEINIGKTAWNPDLLEIAITGAQEADNPETWAMFLHQQRFPDDYRNGLALPLILHLAKLASEYALPHEDPEQADVTDPVPEAGEDEMLDLEPPDQEG
jgi:RNaseH domain of pPIWI_RE